MKRIYLLPIFLILSAQVSGQFLANIDSAKKVMQSLRDDTAKVNLLHQVALSYCISNKDSAFVYATQEYNLAQKLNYPKGLAMAYSNFSYYNYIQGNGSQALEYAFKMLLIAEQLNDNVVFARCYSSIAGGYSLLHNYREALQWQKKAYAAVALSPDLHSKARYSNNLGNDYFGANLPDSALLYFQQSYRISDSLHDKSVLCYPVNGLAKTNFALGKLEEGKRYCRQLISLAKASGNTALLSLAYKMLAEQFLKEHKKDSSLHYAKNAIIILESLDSKYNLIDEYTLLAKLFQSNHQTDSAFKYEAKIVALKDSIEAENNQSQLQSFAFEQKMREKEKADAVRKTTEAYQHQQDRERNEIIIFSLLGALFVFGIIAFILYRNNAQKQKANNLLHQQKEQIQNTLAELKSTQAQLIQNEKMASLGELTAGIAHEIQNPLNFVNNFSEINTELIEELEAEAKQGNLEEVVAIANDIRDNEKKIIHHGKRADSIVKGMLEHSRTSKGEKQLTNINALADEYLRLAYHGLRAKEKSFNTELTTHFDERIGKVNIVPQDIGRVLLNLFNNAFYAVTEKQKALALKGERFEPEVSVTSLKQNGSITIKVSDNGNGIPKNIKDKIFQPFFTTKPTGQGTGLGLSLSYDIIKAHGGEIKVESQEGEGTTFIIQLPA